MQKYTKIANACAKIMKTYTHTQSSLNNMQQVNETLVIFAFPGLSNLAPKQRPSSDSMAPHTA